MAEKDVTEKILEANNDVFSDIINGCLYQGEQVVLPDDLQDHFAIRSYENKGKLYSTERDVSKLWTDGVFTIACLGVENQTNIDVNMPLRVIAYDGNIYKKQADDHVSSPYPVITLVLYFGDQPWKTPLSLFDRLTINEKLKPFVNDYKIHVFDISHMTKEQAQKFNSDFKVVADYFAQIFENGYYKGNPQELKHPEDTFTLMKYVTGIEKFEQFINAREEGGAINMYDPFKDAEKRGEAQGRAIGEARLAKLLQKLYELGRTEDVQKAVTNKSYRDNLMKEFAIQ